MRLAIRILAALMIFLGIVWILQGIDVLPGSFMTGQIKWAWRGALFALIGVALLFIPRRLLK